MYYYEIVKNLSNIYDLNDLRIVGYCRVFTDEAKTQELTQLPFSELGVQLSFADVPHATKEEYDAYIENIVLTAVGKEEIQAKLGQVKVAKDLGLI